MPANSINASDTTKINEISECMKILPSMAFSVLCLPKFWSHASRDDRSSGGMKILLQSWSLRCSTPFTPFRGDTNHRQGGTKQIEAS